MIILKGDIGYNKDGTKGMNQSFLRVGAGAQIDKLVLILIFFILLNKEHTLREISKSVLFIVKEMRQKTNGKHPRYIVWENVPGAFSSNKGEDFRCVLEAACWVKDDELSIPRPAKWPYAGCIMGNGWWICLEIRLTVVAVEHYLVLHKSGE